MNVLVTGATGFVGQHVVSELLRRGHTVVALGRSKTKAKELQWSSLGVEFVAHDIETTSPLKLSAVGNPDVLLHLAWSGLPNYQALDHFERYPLTNYFFLKSLIEQGLRHVLVTGTCLEYGMSSGCLSVDIPSMPQNPYALGKDTLRKFLQGLQKEFPFTLQWARLFYIYGKGQNPKSLLALLDQSIARGDKVFNMSLGEQLRDYLPVEAVAQALVNLIQQPTLDGIFNICSGKPISIRRLIEERLAERGVMMKLNLGHYPYPDYEPFAFWGKPSANNVLRSSVIGED